MLKLHTKWPFLKQTPNLQAWNLSINANKISSKTKKH
jgi:hypothetical protein